MHPLPPGNPYSYIAKAQLHPVDDSHWLGQAVHGPYRRPYIVQRANHYSPQTLPTPETPR
ncbi:hypothetical protein ACFY1P_32885 [Streptomyces sp. NPDC001407]|uniref:hypothetical protein n=1 Tax=Streptomyces sp. NPDC001407 TaxID=3364573 RepID=UPI0036AE7BB9